MENPILALNKIENIVAHSWKNGDEMGAAYYSAIKWIFSDLRELKQKPHSIVEEKLNSANGYIDALFFNSGNFDSNKSFVLQDILALKRLFEPSSVS